MSFALDVGERGGAGWGAKGAEVTGADFWAYALYAPTYLHGPTHQFADFHAQFRRLSQARADKGKRHPDGPPGGWAPPPGSAAEVARMLGTVGAMFAASVSVYMPTVVWYYLRSTALDVGPRPGRRRGPGARKGVWVWGASADRLLVLPARRRWSRGTTGRSSCGFTASCSWPSRSCRATRSSGSRGRAAC